MLKISDPIDELEKTKTETKRQSYKMTLLSKR